MAIRTATVAVIRAIFLLCYAPLFGGLMAGLDLSFKGGGVT